MARWRLHFESLIEFVCIHVDMTCGAFRTKTFFAAAGVLAEHVSTPGWGGLAGWKLEVLLGAETGPTGVLGRVGNRGLRQERVSLRTWNDFTAPKVSGFSWVASFASFIPSPIPEQFFPCVLRGRERKRGKSYFSKLLSSSSLPCDSCRGRENWEGAESSDFPECKEISQSTVWLPFTFLIRPCILSTS